MLPWRSLSSQRRRKSWTNQILACNDNVSGVGEASRPPPLLPLLDMDASDESLSASRHNKAFETHDLYYEIVKYLDDACKLSLLAFDITSLANPRDSPFAWTKLQNDKNVTQYRPLALTDILANICGKLLHPRLQVRLPSFTPSWSLGFRPGSSCTHVLCLCQQLIT